MATSPVTTAAANTGGLMSVEAARDAILAAAEPVGTERVAVADALARIEHGGDQRLRGDGGRLGRRRTEELIFVDDVGSVRGAGHAHTISAPRGKALNAVLRALTRRRCL